MATFTKNGLRKVKVQDKIKVKKQVKEFYTRIGQIDKIAEYLNTLEDKVTEDNIDSIVPELIGRELDSLERTLILSKLHNEQGNNTI